MMIRGEVVTLPHLGRPAGLRGRLRGTIRGLLILAGMRHDLALCLLLPRPAIKDPTASFIRGMATTLVFDEGYTEYYRCILLAPGGVSAVYVNGVRQWGDLVTAGKTKRSVRFNDILRSGDVIVMEPEPTRGRR